MVGSKHAGDESMGRARVKPTFRKPLICGRRGAHENKVGVGQEVHGRFGDEGRDVRPVFSLRADSKWKAKTVASKPVRQGLTPALSNEATLC